MAVTEGQLVSDGTAVWKVRRIGVTGIPTGFIGEWSANTIPDGWLLCDGSAISRTDYADLFAVIGTTWGDGDGSTTFNLPNSIGRFAEGASNAGSYHEAGLPNIEGTISNASSYGILDARSNYRYSTSGAFYDYQTKTANYQSANGTAKNFGIDASRCSSIYGNSTTVQPASYTVRKIIKY